MTNIETNTPTAAEHRWFTQFLNHIRNTSTTQIPLINAIHGIYQCYHLHEEFDVLLLSQEVLVESAPLGDQVQDLPLPEEGLLSFLLPSGTLGTVGEIWLKTHNRLSVQTASTKSTHIYAFQAFMCDYSKTILINYTTYTIYLHQAFQKHAIVSVFVSTLQ